MRQRLLALLRLSEQPDPPPGAGSEVETFRATPGFFRYTVLMWFPKQVAAFLGLLFSLAFFGGLNAWGADLAESKGWDKFQDKLADADIGMAWLRFDLADIILFFEGVAIVTFVAQLVFTGLLLRLSWEQRWYIVGERSLRIRHGLWKVREQTMTIANIQNMVVRQGPLQRFLGFSDLDVRTAGGGATGSSGEDSSQQKDSFHVARLRGLEDASALRDKIRQRLLAVKDETGREARSAAPRLGAGAESAGPAKTEPDDLAAAARALLAEARALRRSA